jgi:MazG family protein
MAESEAVSPPSFVRLQEIVAQLRGPNGCPWDRKQSPETLTKYLREECNELVEAINQKDSKEVCEEIGDVLFLLAFLIAIYSEKGRFTADDVFSGVVEKMIRRHPHVFAGLQVADEHALHEQWQRIKSQEKQSEQSR